MRASSPSASPAGTSPFPKGRGDLGKEIEYTKCHEIDIRDTNRDTPYKRIQKAGFP